MIEYIAIIKEVSDITMRNDGAAVDRKGTCVFAHLPVVQALSIKQGDPAFIFLRILKTPGVPALSSGI